MRRVLEVGTGCGYQCAVLAQLVRRVFTIERIGVLQTGAQARLAALGYHNISYLAADGFAGWASNQPFDGIMVTAAPCQVPLLLVAQLKIGGRMVVPVGEPGAQRLRIITRTAHDAYDEEMCSAVHFVPMVDGCDNGRR